MFIYYYIFLKSWISSLKKKYLLIVLKGRVTYTEDGTEKSSICWFTPQIATMPGVDLARTRNLFQVSWIGTTAQALGHPVLLYKAY